MHCLLQLSLRWLPSKARALATAGLAAALLSSGGPARAADYSIVGLARDFRGAIELPLPDQIVGEGPGIPIAGTAMQTGAAVPSGGPGTITLPPGVVFNPRNPQGFLIPVPQVIQLTSSASHFGPTGSTTLMANRAGPFDFAYCPGATANPSCTTASAGGSQGTLNGIIKYTSGPNKFGGTFKMLISGTATLVNKGAALPPTTMTQMGGTRSAEPFSASQQPIGGTVPVAHGRTYAWMYTGMLDVGVRTHPFGYKNTPKGLLSSGYVIGTGVAGSNQNTGFPMTTGTIYVYARIGAQASLPAPPRKFTSQGYDHRTPLGAGRIQLVGGGLSRNYPADGSNPPEGSASNRTRLTITFTQQPALPLGSPPVLLGLGALLLLGAGRALTRRVAA